MQIGAFVSSLPPENYFLIGFAKSVSNQVICFWKQGPFILFEKAGKWEGNNF